MAAAAADKATRGPSFTSARTVVLSELDDDLKEKYMSFLVDSNIQVRRANVDAAARPSAPQLRRSRHAARACAVAARDKGGTPSPRRDLGAGAALGLPASPQRCTRACDAQRPAPVRRPSRRSPR